MVIKPADLLKAQTNHGKRGSADSDILYIVLYVVAITFVPFLKLVCKQFPLIFAHQYIAAKV